MKRRVFLSVAGGVLAWSFAGAAQQGARSKRLAIFSPSEQGANLYERGGNKFNRALFAELRRLGQVEGQNLKVERYAREQSTSGPEALAAEVVQSNPDVIFIVGPYPLVFKKLTPRIPIVTIAADPVKIGIAESLARPGGNFTGVSIDAGSSIHAKRIELLREIVPAMSKLGCLVLRSQWEQGHYAPTIRAAAEMAGLALAVALVEHGAGEAGYRTAIERISSDAASAVMVVDSPELFQNFATIAKLASEKKLPAMFPFAEGVEAGGLMAYSVDLIELYKRAANNIDAILRGAKPGEIPFYQATKFELSVNLKTARQLGLTVPPALVVGADKMIE
ncbi:ABC transporter substrate-binding protein [Bradyrhizobium lablabi]|uniref:ABC transporter substrate-binding protein n=1 Tax=Bradyrhizobium lablabi TaxID=722472 RepID=UPI001BA47660|nr:ABC transporter substrate-binding protein [Bradyrhizobium lablabi]MBR1122018.1 ABC transporter substrate-binding protein [Bradyrhizobium lablabi]